MRETLASLGLEVGDAMHDDVMEEQRLVVDLDVSGQQAAKVLHIPEQRDQSDVRGFTTEGMNTRSRQAFTLTFSLSAMLKEAKSSLQQKSLFQTLNTLCC